MMTDTAYPAIPPIGPVATVAIFEGITQELMRRHARVPPHVRIRAYIIDSNLMPEQMAIAHGQAIPKGFWIGKFGQTGIDVIWRNR